MLADRRCHFVGKLGIRVNLVLAQELLLLFLFLQVLSLDAINLGHLILEIVRTVVSRRGNLVQAHLL